MRKQNIILRGLISLGVAAALLLAPLAAPLAAALPAIGTTHAMHEGATVADASGLHADHGKAQAAADAAADNNVPCDRHDHHDGKCCATCVQCLTATPAMPAMFIPTHSPKLSAVPRLYDRLVVAARDRPPAV